MLVRVGDRVRSRTEVPVHLLHDIEAVVVEGRVFEIDLQNATATFRHEARPEWPNPFTLKWRDLVHAEERFDREQHAAWLEAGMRQLLATLRAHNERTAPEGRP